MVKLLSGSADAKEIEKMFHKVGRVFPFSSLSFFLSSTYSSTASLSPRPPRPLARPHPVHLGKVDKNNNGVLDFEELQQFVSKAFDVMAKSKDLGDSAIPSTHGSAVPVKQWPDAHETIRRDICTEVTTALLR